MITIDRIEHTKMHNSIKIDRMQMHRIQMTKKSIINIREYVKNQQRESGLIRDSSINHKCGCDLTPSGKNKNNGIPKANDYHNTSLCEKGTDKSPNSSLIQDSSV